MKGLSGRVALITGAARDRGIGQGIAKCLAAQGCSVAINDIGAEDEATDFIKKLRANGASAGSNGASAGFYEADVSDRVAVNAMMDDVEKDLGPLDIVCSNAGVAAWEPFEEIADATFDRLVSVNLTGAFNVGQEAARRMLDGGKPGRIIFSSSVHVQMPFAEMAVYGATKQAIRALTETMAIELGSKGITVNHLGPGWVKSALNDDSPSLQTEADERATVKLIPVGRPAEPEEMGHAVVYLCGDDAAYVTGEFLRVDGGFVVGKY